jgi:spore germination protein GerM
MKRNSVTLIALVVAIVAVTVVTLVVVAVRRRPVRSDTSVTAPAASGSQVFGRKIKARLYYVSMDGTRLTGVDREVSYSEGSTALAQQIVNAQLAPVPAGLVSAIPLGTTLRALYLDEKGDVFVDLSKEVSTAHPGGSQNELLTIYAIVDALTANLPAVKSVQLLVDGRQVDTLAGHIDLRKPFQKNLAIIEP